MTPFRRGQFVWLEFRTLLEHDKRKSKLELLEAEISKLKSELAGIRMVASERAQEHKEVVTQMGRLKTMADAIPDAVFVFSRDIRYVDYCAENDNNLLVAPSKFLGCKPTDVLPWEFAEAVEKRVAMCFSSVQPVSYYYTRNLGDRKKWFHVKVVPKGDRAVSVIRNITQILRDFNLDAPAGRLDIIHIA